MICVMTASGFVKKYLAGIGLLICLVVLSVFWGFYFRQAELIEKQQLYQGQGACKIFCVNEKNRYNLFIQNGGLQWQKRNGTLQTQH